MVYSNKYKFRKLRGTVQDSINEERARQNEDFNRRLKNAEDSMKAIYPEEYKKIRSRYFGNGNNLGLIGSQYNYIHDMITRRSDDQMKKYYNELNDYFIKQTGTEPGYMLPGVDVNYNGEAPDWVALRQNDFNRLYSPIENSDYLNSVEKENARNAYFALQNKNGDSTFDHDGYFDYDPNNGLLNTEANYARATGSYSYTPEERKAAAIWERAENSPIVTAMEFSPLFPVVAGVKAVAAANAPQAGDVDVGMNAAFAALPAIAKSKDIANTFSSGVKFIGNTVKEIPNKIFVKPNTFTRGIGDENGLIDLVQSNVVRGNPRGTNVSARKYGHSPSIKSLSKLSEKYPDIQSHYNNGTLTEEEFNAIRNEFPKQNKIGNSNRFILKKDSPSDLNNYKDYNDYKNAILNEQFELNAKTINEQGQSMAYYYDDGRNMFTQGHDYAKSDYGIRINNPEDYGPYIHPAHLHKTLRKPVTFWDPNLEIYKRGIFGIPRKLDKNKLAAQYGMPTEKMLNASGEEITNNLLRAIGKDINTNYVNNDIESLRAYEPELVSMLEKNGVDLSKFSKKDLRDLIHKRILSLEKTSPDRYNISLHDNLTNTDKIIDYLKQENDKPVAIGEITLKKNNDGLYGVDYVEKLNNNFNNEQNRLTDAAIQLAHDKGFDGVVSGEHLLKPEITIDHVWPQYTEKQLIGNNGIHEYQTSIIHNGEVYLLKQPTKVRATKSIIFDPRIVDENGNFRYSWRDSRPYYSNGGVLDATYIEQINRIRQPRFAGWRFKDGGIYIKEENRGKFTEYAKRHGKTVPQMEDEVLSNKDKYPTTIVRRAVFSRNARTKFNH